MKVVFLKIWLALSGLIAINSIYTIHITTMSGEEKSMQDFSGKKIMVVVLPVTQSRSDSTFLRSLDSLNNAFPNLSLIAVPPFEDGYDLSNSTALRNFYEGLLGNRIIITKGMYTRKGAAQNQHELFSWLTHKEKNIHFDMDVSGVRQMFFINQQGELVGVVEPQAGWNNRILQRMLQ